MQPLEECRESRLSHLPTIKGDYRSDHQSVLDQDYPNLEYIINRWRLTDESVEVIRRYESRLAYWVSGTGQRRIPMPSRKVFRSVGNDYSPTQFRRPLPSGISQGNCSSHAYPSVDVLTGNSTGSTRPAIARRTTSDAVHCHGVPVWRLTLQQPRNILEEGSLSPEW